MLRESYLVMPALLYACLWLYRRAYPRPYPGIPFNEKSSKRLLGDLPDLLATTKTTKDPAKFVFQQCRKLQSPVIQLFLKPFHKPVIFIDDVREVKDLIGLRTKEFDRAPSTIAVFEPLSPHSSIVKPTNIERKDQRRYWEGLMGKRFLNDVVAPKMYDTAQQIVALFKVKAAIANGRPFAVADDFDIAAFDIIWWSIMGTKLDGVKSQREALLKVKDTLKQPPSMDVPTHLPSIPTPEIHQGMNYFIHSIEKTLRSFNQPWHHWVLRQLPTYRKYWAFKNKLLTTHIENARTLYASLTDEEVRERAETCALDIGVSRERLEFKDKFGKVAVPSTVELHDELFLFLIAGHDTTAVTLAWAVKYLTNYPETQSKLRSSLQKAYSLRSATTTDSNDNSSHNSNNSDDDTNSNHPNQYKTFPTAEEIVTTPIPYMDVCLEEIVRLSNIHPRLVRIATRDTSVLGHPIPKGAQVLSSSYVGEEPIEVPEDLRSRQSQQCKDNFRAHWDPNGMNDFVPERWLITDDEGKEKFEPKNFPRLAFSAGPRICYGQRFALQELRITLTLLVLNFTLDPVPEEMSTLAGFQRVLRYPRKCYVRVTSLS